jgi:hypothetical protein
MTKLDRDPLPMSARRCVTHHFACDCREERLAKLERVADAARNVGHELRHHTGQHSDCWACSLMTIYILPALSALDGRK